MTDIKEWGDESHGASADDIASAISRRIMASDFSAFVAQLRDVGKDIGDLTDAIEDVASWHEGAEELGSSDISIMVREVKRQLGLTESVTEVSTEKLRDYASAALQDKNKDKADKRWKYAGKATQTVADREAQDAHDRKHNNVKEAVTLAWNRYVRSHGKKPRDDGNMSMWMFTTQEYGMPHDDDIFQYSGSLKDAKKAAAKWAKGKGAYRFYVMEDAIQEQKEQLNKEVYTRLHRVFDFSNFKGNDQ